ncbi:MAG TPA: hypothetical protein VKU41_12655 [Polyangiaceae bacterium]|nr:hypothetical protein [Polyangiaceae bacterium]
MRFRRRAMGWIGLVVACVYLLPAARDARASSAIAVTWDGLLRASTAVVVATAGAPSSRWENGRIYTYTPVHVDRSVSGNLPAGADAVVRTMGGVVGSIGQSVEGEALFTAGRPSMLFLQPAPGGSAYDVTARGQGQFPVIADDATRPARVVRNFAGGVLFRPALSPPAAPPQLAAELLHGRTVDDAVREVVSAWNRTHPG